MFGSLKVTSLGRPPHTPLSTCCETCSATLSLVYGACMIAVLLRNEHVDPRLTLPLFVLASTSLPHGAPWIGRRGEEIDRSAHMALRAENVLAGRCWRRLPGLWPWDCVGRLADID